MAAKSSLKPSRVRHLHISVTNRQIINRKLKIFTENNFKNICTYLLYGSNDCNEWPLTVKKTEDTCKVKPSACGQVKKNNSTAYIFNLLNIAITKNTEPIFCDFGKSKTVFELLITPCCYYDVKMARFVTS